jgi:hypothetical protein
MKRWIAHLSNPVFSLMISLAYVLVGTILVAGLDATVLAKHPLNDVFFLATAIPSFIQFVDGEAFWLVIIGQVFSLALVYAIVHGFVVVLREPRKDKSSST